MEIRALRLCVQLAVNSLTWSFLLYGSSEAEEGFEYRFAVLCDLVEFMPVHLSFRFSNNFST